MRTKDSIFHFAVNQTTHSLEISVNLPEIECLFKIQLGLPGNKEVSVHNFIVDATMKGLSSFLFFPFATTST